MTYTFKRPCVECGELTDSGNRCEKHPRQERRSPDKQLARKIKKAQYYNSTYRKLAKMVRDGAEICHICGKGANPNDPWTADHLEPGNPQSPLAPAHKSCNSSRGNKQL